MFSNTTPSVVVGDKTGDVKVYKLGPPGSTTTTSKHLLSHTGSMVTTLNLHPPSNPAVVVTGDRDEKVLFHNFPDTYVLNNTIMGEHSVWISAVAIIGDIVLIGDGNGVVSCWKEGVHLWTSNTGGGLINGLAATDEKGGEVAVATEEGGGKVLGMEDGGVRGTFGEGAAKGVAGEAERGAKRRDHSVKHWHQKPHPLLLP